MVKTRKNIESITALELYLSMDP